MTFKGVSKMADFFVLIDSLVGQVKDFVVQERRAEGFLIRTNIEPVGRIFISPAQKNTAHFWLPEETLSFRTKQEIPSWLPDFLENRTKDKLAKWTLIEIDGGFIYNLEYIEKLNKLTPETFEKICRSTMGESISLKFFIINITTIYRKSFTELNAEQINFQSPQNDSSVNSNHTPPILGATSQKTTGKNWWLIGGALGFVIICCCTILVFLFLLLMFYQ